MGIDSGSLSRHTLRAGEKNDERSPRALKGARGDTKCEGGRP